MASLLRKFIYAGLALVLLLAAGQLRAQSTGIIRGTATDSTGAAVPDAGVTVTNTETGQVRSAATTSSGVFDFPDLPIGNYTIAVSKAGFKSQKREGTQLLTGQTIDLVIALDVGSQTESVTVEADNQQIQTATSTVAQSVDEKQMQDLPLNGRNPLQLTTLTPGVVITNVGTESGQQDNQGISVNGLRATQNNYQLDGGLYVDRFFDSVPILPSPDALQEFTVQAANFSAAYAGAGALVQLSSRTGTNKFHGSAFEFFRNTVLDAFNYFPVKINGKIVNPPYKQNQFGGTIGGPIHKDKTFFFFSAEDLQRRSSPNPVTLTLPTAAFVAGDFSALCTVSPAGQCTAGNQLYNPVTGQPYPGNKIPTTMDPLSAAVYKQYLAATPGTPTSATANTLSSFVNQNVDSTQYLTRIVHTLTSKDQLSGRYFYDEDNFQRSFTAPLGFYAENLFRNQSLTLSDTHIFSPTLTATLYATGARFARTQIPEAPGLQTLQALGQNIPLGTNAISIFPGVRANITNYIDIFSGGALKQDSTEFEYKGEVVKLIGAHTITMGGNLERTRIDAVDYSYVPGDNTFNGARTQCSAAQQAAQPTGLNCNAGNSFADFYIGYESSFFQDNGRKFYLREWRPSLFVQDDWKATRELTVNAGLRWDPWLPPIDKNNTLVGFVPGFHSTVAPNAPVGLQFNGDPGAAPSVYKNNFLDFGPRIGFAYNMNGAGKTVVRGAFGIFYGFPEGLLYQRTDAIQPVDLYLNIPNPPQWDNVYTGFPGGDPFPRPAVNPSQFANYQFITPVSGGVLDPASKVAYTEDYNLTVEQQLPGQFALSVAYVGNHALHIMSSRQFNPAVPAVGATAGNENSRRLYPGLGAVELAQSYEYAMYNSLQVNITRRVNHSLTLLTNVVYSKVIDNASGGSEGTAGPTNPFNLNSGRAVADFDQKMRFNASINYTLPKFQGNKIVGSVLNGWQANSIIAVQTGLPITIAAGSDRSLTGTGNDYADFVSGVSIAPPAGSAKTIWFNKAAFTPAALQTFGDTPRNFLRGPGYVDVDASLFKELFKESRVHGQFRAEAFNLFNHTNFNNPVATASAGNDGSITGAGQPRLLQFGAKILF